MVMRHLVLVTLVFYDQRSSSRATMTFALQAEPNQTQSMRHPGRHMCGRVDNAPPLGERPALNLQACHCGRTSIGKPFHAGGHRYAHSARGRRVVEVISGHACPGSGGNDVNHSGNEQGRNDGYRECFAHDGPPSSFLVNKADRAKAM
jgi:hypothetical protein